MWLRLRLATTELLLLLLFPLNHAHIWHHHVSICSDPNPKASPLPHSPHLTHQKVLLAQIHMSYTSRLYQRPQWTSKNMNPIMSPYCWRSSNCLPITSQMDSHTSKALSFPAPPKLMPSDLLFYFLNTHIFSPPGSPHGLFPPSPAGFSSIGSFLA